MYLNKPATVDFDPTNKEHRAAFRAFMKRKAWADCSMRFTHDPGYGSVSEQVQAKMLDWYVAQDEARESKKKVPLSKKPIKSLGVIAIAGDKKLAFEMAGIASALQEEHQSV